MPENRAERRRKLKEIGPLHSQELRLAPTIDSGATDGTVARNMLGLTQNVSGLTIVDIASGASTLVADLLTAGADAYGVDRMYDTSILDRLAEEGVNKVAINYINHGHPELAVKVKNSLKRFHESFDEEGLGRYKYGWMTDLPFPDDFADVVTSVNGLTLLGKNFDLMWQGIREGLRIAKPNTPLILVPFHHSPPHIDYINVHNQILNRLRIEGYKTEIQQVREIPGSHMRRLKTWK